MDYFNYLVVLITTAWFLKDIVYFSMYFFLVPTLFGTRLILTQHFIFCQHFFETFLNYFLMFFCVDFCINLSRMFDILAPFIFIVNTFFKIYSKSF